MFSQRLKPPVKTNERSPLRFNTAWGVYNITRPIYIWNADNTAGNAADHRLGLY